MRGIEVISSYECLILAFECLDSLYCGTEGVLYEDEERGHIRMCATTVAPTPEPSQDKGGRSSRLARPKFVRGINSDSDSDSGNLLRRHTSSLAAGSGDLMQRHGGGDSTLTLTTQRWHGSRMGSDK